MIKHILWDAGGTLFDTYPAMVNALQQTLYATGYHADKGEIQALLQISRENAFTVLAQRFGLDRSALEADYRARYSLADSSEQMLFPGALDVCTYIVQHGGCNLIITHRSRQGLKRLLDAHQLNSMFCDCITSDDDFPRKPDPASVLALISKHALNPDEVLLVGDRELDVEAGIRAGVQTCLFSPTASDTKTDLVISHYSELLAHLLCEAGCVSKGRC